MDIAAPRIAGYRLVAPVFAEVSADAPLGLAGPADVAGPADLAGDAAPGPRVWRGVRLADGLPVAVKVFAVGDAEQAEREAAIGRDLCHPHMLTAVDVVCSPDAVALVFPWAVGGSLAQLIGHRRRLPWAETLTVLIPLADALSAAHERGYVHGDVSADNVLFDAGGRPLLADFGAARAAQEAGMPVAVTPADVAPEIVRGAKASPASDLFSLGSVALRCLSGAPAWPADDLEDVVAQSAVGQWPDVDGRMAPAEFCAIVRRLLAPEPADRGSAGQVALELRSVGDPEPVGLVRIDDNGMLRGPVASTMLRPDAVRPPVARSAPAAHRRRRPRAWASLPGWRAALIGALLVALLAGAIRFGTWWSDQGTVRPVVAGVTTEPHATPLDGDGFPPDPARRRVEPPAPSSSAENGAADVDWYAVVRALDAARSAAFVAGDASALRNVYADAAPARAEDAERIAALVGAKRYVTAAGHVIRSAALVDRAPTGEATIEVLESLPPYPVYAADGSLVGYTRPAPASSVLMHLQPSGSGYRIRTVGTSPR